MNAIVPYMRRGQRHVSLLTLLTGVAFLSASAPVYIFAEELEAVLPDVTIVELPGEPFQQEQMGADPGKEVKIAEPVAGVEIIEVLEGEGPEKEPEVKDEFVLEIAPLGIELRVAAAIDPPFITSMNSEMPAISGFGYQTALKEGDGFALSVRLSTGSDIESVIVDLSEIGLGDTVALTATSYDPAFYRKEGLVLPSGIADGVKTLRYRVTDIHGQTGTNETTVIIDNTPPVVSIDFAPTNQERVISGTNSYLSGSVAEESGSVQITSAYHYPTDAVGNIIPTIYSYGAGINSVRTLAAGEFHNEASTMSELMEPATHLVFAFGARDRAGNITYATTSPIAYYIKGTEPQIEPAMSNVFFLPGVKGTRLYGPDDEELWLPSGDDAIRTLFLSTAGIGVTQGIHVREDEILNKVSAPFDAFQVHFYTSFMEDMNALKNAGKITDWEPVAYDWRQSLYRLTSNGVLRDGKIFYEESSDTPYMKERLIKLAQTSKTGKVTIVAHSNGGLVAKALMSNLGIELQKKYIDRVIFVGVPQSGSPQAIGTLLYGHKESLPFMYSPYVGRTFTQNAPVAYHLLPSKVYIEDATARGNPVIKFSSASSYPKEFEAYGETIDNWEELRDFILANEGGRTKPNETDLKTAEIGNASLMSYARDVHEEFDTWETPIEVETYQIAGTNLETVSGVELYQEFIPFFEPFNTYRPTFVTNGDTVVPHQSALLMHPWSGAAHISNLWIDLKRYELTHKKSYRHENLFEMPELISVITNLLDGTEDPLPEFFGDSEPLPYQEKKLYFFLHSPLTLNLQDAQGNILGLNKDGVAYEDIPGSSYGLFGEVQFAIVPADAKYTLALDAYETGDFTLEIFESENGAVTASTTFATIPVTPSTNVTMQINGGIENLSNLVVDSNGDGISDLIYTPAINEIVATPTVIPTEDPVIDDPEASTGTSSGGNTYGNRESETAVAATSPLLTAPLTELIPHIALPFLQETSVESASSLNNILSGLTSEQEEVTESALNDLKLDKQTQTASVYDSVSKLGWNIGEITLGIYNFIKSILSMLFSNLQK